MLARCNTEGYVVLALRAFQLGFRNLELAEGAGREGFWVVIDLDRLSSGSLDLFLEFGIHVVDVFGSDQNTRKLVSCLFEASLSALSYSSCQNIYFGRWKLRNIVADSNKHSSRTHMITHFDEALSELEGVEIHQFVVEIEWNFQIVLLNIFVSVQ